MGEKSLPKMGIVLVREGKTCWKADKNGGQTTGDFNKNE
jgi:hypothetical protein